MVSLSPLSLFHQPHYSHTLSPTYPPLVGLIIACHFATHTHMHALTHAPAIPPSFPPFFFLPTLPLFSAYPRPFFLLLSFMSKEWAVITPAAFPTLLGKRHERYLQQSSPASLSPLCLYSFEAGGLLFMTRSVTKAIYMFGLHHKSFGIWICHQPRASFKFSMSHTILTNQPALHFSNQPMIGFTVICRCEIAEFSVKSAQ